MIQSASELLKNKYWIANEGPQTEAYYSKADLLLYGGAAGGGKTDLIIGLALNEHHRVGIFRQQGGELQGLKDRMDAILIENGFKTITKDGWKGPDGKKVEFGHLELPRSEQSWQGRDHDLKCFDEASQISPAKIQFVMGWLRSTKEGQRCRAILASNPPIGGEGDYLLEWFGPWIDPAHELHGTVRPGELLYAFFLTDGDETVTHWCDGPEAVEIDGDMHTPTTRTFIPAGLSDNPFLGEKYRTQLDSMPEPLRTALLTGDFLVGRVDHAMQVIPTEWVKLAQERWKERKGHRRKMIAMGVDVAQGGPDMTTLARLDEEHTFDHMIRAKGVDTKDGPAVGGLVVTNMRNGCVVAIDMTGGWGGGAKTHLEENDIHVIGMVASEGTEEKSADGGLTFLNKRALWWWQFREALDPKSGEDVALPPDPRTTAELTCVRWKLSSRKVQIESKDDIRKRLRRSTDDADAIITAWNVREQGIYKVVMQGSDNWNDDGGDFNLDDYL